MNKDASTDSKAPVRVWLVKTNEELSEDMLTALHLCGQYRSNGILAEWITQEDCINKNEITKKDVFVLEAFSGRVFERLSATKAIIVGPKCLSCCLNDGEEIPRGATFTIAMRDLIVTISGFSATDKEKLKKYIMWMGGRCENQLTEETTHLISKTVFSDKYIKAATFGVPIMKGDWVEVVWKESLKKNISAKNPQFDEYKLPIFFGICATTTGIKNKRERKTIMELLTKNGGKFFVDFESSKINILILNNEGIGSKKHSCAVECDIACVSVSWIHKSVEKGYALDHREFPVEPLNKNVPKTSSPNRPSQLPDMSINVSCIKNIKSNNFVEETCSTTSSDSTFMPYSSQRSQNVKNLQLYKIAKEFSQFIDNIEIKSVKQAGPFLDGCSVYVYGASPSRRDKLQRIISLAGGVRFDEPGESVSHTICCDPNVRLTTEQLLAVPNANHVTILWLIECIKLHKAVEEIQYIVSSNDTNTPASNIKSKVTMPSPMSKRNMQLLQTPTVRPPVPLFNLDLMEDDDNDVEIVQQYLSQPSNIEHENVELHTTIQQQEDNDVHNENSTLKKTDITNENNSPNKSNESDEESVVFKGLTFELRDIDEEAEEITAQILNAGGTVVKSSRRKSKHYILVPMNYDAECSNTKAEIITSAWLEDCLNTETLVPIDYYHKPLKSIPESKPLSGFIISISMYVGSERKFLSDIATLLGATVKSVLHKRMSTHLICAKPEGAKYEGAVNWGITVVTNKWLLDCLAAEKRLREGPYLVGSSKEPEWDNPEENSEPEPKEQSRRTAFSSSIRNINVNSIENKTEDSIHSNISVKKNANEVVNIEPNDRVIENKLLSQIERQPSNNSPVGRSITRLSLGNAEMSPASRYIAMNRQGMISNSQDTPKKTEEIIKTATPSNDTMSTPPMDNALSTPNIALFSTTSKRRILAVKRGEIPSNPPRTPKNPFEMSMSTPDSHFGALLRPGSSKMSPNSRKKLKNIFDAFPSPLTSKQTKPETPVSELENQFFKKYLENTPNRKHTLDEKKTPNDNTDIRPAKQLKLSDEPNFSNNAELQDKLRLLDTMLTGGEGSKTVSTPRSLKHVRSSVGLNTISNINMYMENVNMNSTAKAGCVESQTDTVGWDDMTETVKVHSFVLAQNVTNSDEIKCIIERLGGTILEGSEFDLNATHFLCSSLCRSEKLLTCLAARKWIIHPDYIIESQKAGRFIDEEFYEWGNPKTKISSSSFTEVQRQLANAAYRWRVKPSSSPLPFHSFKVILHMKESRKDPISRILKAGGGEVVDISPPFKGNINATHCFVEPQHKPISQADLQFLVTNNVPVCPPLFLNIFLVSDPAPSPMDHLCLEYKRLLNK